MFYVLKAALK